MTLDRPRCAIAALVAPLALLVSAGRLDAALPTPDERPAPASLAGQLLIASPKMGDPRFDHTVVLLVQHSRDGALGLIINRPLGERPLAGILQILGEKESAVGGSVRVFVGGPVQPQLGFVIHSTDYRRAETVDIDGRVAVTSTPEILRDIARDKGPKKTLVAFGYAGWAPGQLEGELEAGAWFTAPEESDLVFDEDRGKLWERAMARRTRDL
jgi:putative transcriptional regulator